MLMYCGWECIDLRTGSLSASFTGKDKFKINIVFFNEFLLIYILYNFSEMSEQVTWWQVRKKGYLSLFLLVVSLHSAVSERSWCEGEWNGIICLYTFDRIILDNGGCVYYNFIMCRSVRKLWWLIIQSETYVDFERKVSSDVHSFHIAVGNRELSTTRKRKIRKIIILISFEIRKLFSGCLPWDCFANLSCISYWMHSEKGKIKKC